MSWFDRSPMLRPTISLAFGSPSYREHGALMAHMHCQALGGTCLADVQGFFTVRVQPLMAALIDFNSESCHNL